jgi:hypothetical protein
MDKRNKSCIIPISKGKVLDRHASLFGIKRKRHFIFFKESDKKLRERILRVMEERENNAYIYDSSST